MGAKRPPSDIETFIRNIERQFDDPIPGGLHPDTRFRDLPNWTSLRALIVVASFEEDYDVTVSDQEFLAAPTVEELYGVVIRRADR